MYLEIISQFIVEWAGNVRTIRKLVVGYSIMVQFAEEASQNLIAYEDTFKNFTKVSITSKMPNTKNIGKIYVKKILVIECDIIQLANLLF